MTHSQLLKFCRATVQGRVYPRRASFPHTTYLCHCTSAQRHYTATLSYKKGKCSPCLVCFEDGVIRYGLGGSLFDAVWSWPRFVSCAGAHQAFHCLTPTQLCPGMPSAALPRPSVWQVRLRENFPVVKIPIPYIFPHIWPQDVCSILSTISYATCY